MGYFDDKFTGKRLRVLGPGRHQLVDAVWTKKFCLMNFEMDLPANTAHPRVVFESKEKAEAQLALWREDEIDKIYVQEIRQCGHHIQVPRGGGLGLPPDDFARTAALACLEAAYEVLGEVPYTGGCTSFWSPYEWIDKEGKNGDYGEACQLVLCYDGGDISQLCNMSKGNYLLHDSFDDKLSKRGYYHEAVFGWCSAVYKTEHRDI